MELVVGQLTEVVTRGPRDELEDETLVEIDVVMRVVDTVDTEVAIDEAIVVVGRLVETELVILDVEMDVLGHDVETEVVGLDVEMDVLGHDVETEVVGLDVETELVVFITEVVTIEVVGRLVETDIELPPPPQQGPGQIHGHMETGPNVLVVATDDDDGLIELVEIQTA